MIENCFEDSVRGELCGPKILEDHSFSVSEGHCNNETEPTSSTLQRTTFKLLDLASSDTEK